MLSEFAMRLAQSPAPPPQSDEGTTLPCLWPPCVWQPARAEWRAKGAEESSTIPGATIVLDELRGPRANGPESIARRLARSLEAARERLSTEVARLGRATAAYRTADVAAAAVRTLALAAELATGPAGALVITATSEAAIAAIATYAVSRTLENIPSDERRYALVHVISRVEEEQLCDPMLAHVWRFAIGSRQGAPSSDWARAAVHVVTGAAVRRVARKRAVAQVLNVAVDLFFRAPEQARSAHRLVARARHHARAFADSL